MCSWTKDRGMNAYPDPETNILLMAEILHHLGCMKPYTVNNGKTTNLNWCRISAINSSHLKMDGWNTIVSFWDALFSGAFAVSFRDCMFYMFLGVAKYF